MIIRVECVVTQWVAWDVSSLASFLAAPRGVSSCITAEILQVPLKALWKLLCTAILFLKDKSCAQGKRQQVTRGGAAVAAQVCASAPVHLWWEHQASVSPPVSSCPPAIDKEIQTEKCTNTPIKNLRQLRLVFRFLSPTCSDPLQPHEQDYPPQLLLVAEAPEAHWVNENPTSAVCGVSSCGNLGQACPAGFRVKI